MSATVANPAGGVLNSSTQIAVGWGANSTGIVNQTGGVINSGHQVPLGWGAGSTGTYNISGATSGPNATVLNASVASDQGIVLGWGNGTGVFNQSGGVVNILHGTLQFGQASAGVTTSTGTYNLSGGILNTPLIQKSFAGNTATFNFNGGTLSPTASAANFMQGLNAANVQAGGAVIDTNGSVITIAQPLLHSGAGTDGGLTLTDSNAGATGNLTLNGANTYNGTTRVISSAGALGPTTLFLGNALAVQNSTVQMTSGLNNSVQFVGGIGAFTFGGLTGSANLSLTDGGSSPVTLSVGNNNSETTFTGALGTAADGANLLKIGSGTLHLTGTQLYSGTTTINGGTLSLNGAGASLANSSSVDVGGAAASGAPTLLARAGANAGAVHVHGPETTGVAGTIAAGDINTFSAASLTLDAGANTTFVLGTPGVGGAGVTADLFAVSNALTLPAAGSVVVNLIDNANAGGLGSFGTGTYKLITDSTTTNFTNTKFGIGIGIPGFQEAFSNPGGKEIDLVVTPAPTWKAVAVDTNWANAANWVNGLVPGVHDGTTTNTDLADFTTASNILTPAPDLNRNLQNITFDQAVAGAYVIGTTGGNALLLTAGGQIQTTALITKTETINAPLVLEGANGSYAFSSNAPSSTNVLMIGGGITGGAAGSTVLTLTGGNTGNNTISGVIADGAATTLALLKSGAGTWVLDKTETNTGGTTILGGTLQLGDGTGNGSVIGPISDGGSLRVANPNPQTISNAISGGGALTAAGAGLLTLTNANSVSGPTTINGGSSLQLGDGVTNILDNGSLTFANPTDLAYAGAIGGSGPVTMSGPGTLTLSGASTYGGSTTISANVTLTSAVAANILPSTTAVTMSGAAALDMSGVVSDQTIGSLGSASAATSVNLGTKNLITGGNGNNTTFAGSISGIGGVVKNGGGTFTLSNANSYSGATAINAGAVQLNHANAAQDSTVTIGVDNGLKFGSGVHTFNVGGLAGAGKLSLTDTAATAVTLNAGSNATDSAYSGVLSGAGGILGKTGSGTLTLSGNNSYSGGTTISDGTLSATTTNTVLGAGPVNMSGGRLQLTGGVRNAIGINFEGANNGSAPTLLLATDSAGVSPQVNWNNVNGTGVTNTAGSGSNTNVDGPIAGTVVDKTGAATAVTLAFNANGQFAVASGQALNTGDRKLMDGMLYMNYFNPPSANHIDVTMSNIPFPLYDAYAYFAASPFSGEISSMTLNADSTTTTFGTAGAGPFAGFVQATGVDLASANSSNYYVFRGRSDGSLTLTLLGPNPGGNGNSGLNGVQLVEAFNPVFAYANNVVVTGNSTIDVSGTPSASLGTLSIGSNTLFVTGSSYGTDLPYGLNLGATSVSGGGTTTFDVANNGAGTGKLTLASLTTGGAGRTITKANAGTMEIQGASTINGGSNINAAGGTLRFNNTSGAATIGAGSTAMVASGATLELAGSFSDLSSTASAASRVHIINSSTRASGGGVVVSGTHQQVGAIDGTGDTVVDAGSDLTADHIVQSSLVIGGTATSAALVTIAASDASGNPLASGFAVAGSLSPSGPFAAGTDGGSSLLASGGSSAGSGSSLGGANLGSGLSSVPEPASLLLMALGGGIALLAALRRKIIRR
jgi:autotransporter-associated beta strand protein